MDQVYFVVLTSNPKERPKFNIWILTPGDLLSISAGTSVMLYSAHKVFERALETEVRLNRKIDRDAKLGIDVTLSTDLNHEVLWTQEPEETESDPATINISHGLTRSIDSRSLISILGLNPLVLTVESLSVTPPHSIAWARLLMTTPQVDFISAAVACRTVPAES